MSYQANNDDDFTEHGPFSTFAVNKDVLKAELSKARDRRKNTTEIALSKATTGGSTSSRSSTEGDASFFLDIFESELLRVTDFIDSQEKHLEFSARVLLTNAENAAQLGGQGQQDHQTLKQKTDLLVENGVELQHFISENYASLKYFATEADQALQTNCIASLERRFVKTGLNSAVLCVVSDIYDVIRVAVEALRNKASGQSSEMWKAPSSFERSTTKYWVKEDRLTELLFVCAAEAPLLVYGKQGSLTSPEHRLSKESEGDKLWSSLATPITSVYFDSPDMSLYKERIARVEGAQLLRARWYGSKPTGGGIIFLELKTHHEKWVNTKSIKERASVRERDMQTFLKRVTWTMNDAQAMILRASSTLEGDKLAKASDLLLRMHKLVVKYKLAPCVRSVYLRAAFQSPKNNGA
jgi:SPX domain protein involved in polyphosphate accumulation